MNSCDSENHRTGHPRCAQLIANTVRATIRGRHRTYAGTLSVAPSQGSGTDCDTSPASSRLAGNSPHRRSQSTPVLLRRNTGPSRYATTGVAIAISPTAAFSAIPTFIMNVRRVIRSRSSVCSCSCRPEVARPSLPSFIPYRVLSASRMAIAHHVRSHCSAYGCPGLAGRCAISHAATSLTSVIRHRMSWHIAAPIRLPNVRPSRNHRRSNHLRIHQRQKRSIQNRSRRPRLLRVRSHGTAHTPPINPPPLRHIPILRIALYGGAFCSSKTFALAQCARIPADHRIHLRIRQQFPPRFRPNAGISVPFSPFAITSRSVSSSTIASYTGFAKFVAAPFCPSLHGTRTILRIQLVERTSPPPAAALSSGFRPSRPVAPRQPKRPPNKSRRIQPTHHGPAPAIHASALGSNPGLVPGPRPSTGSGNCAAAQSLPSFVTVYPATSPKITCDAANDHQSIFCRKNGFTIPSAL